jgi:MFS family permease
MQSVRREGTGISLMLFVMGIAVAMDGIDGSAVIVALPTIAQSLGTDAGTASWVTVSYFMMMAALLLVFGKMAYRGAVKRVFVLGLGVFTFLTCHDM